MRGARRRSGSDISDETLGKGKRLGGRSVGRNPQRSVLILLLETCSATRLSSTGSLSGGLIRLVADEPVYLPLSGNNHISCLFDPCQKVGLTILGTLRRRATLTMAATRL
jgi:hypothetical protein